MVSLHVLATAAGALVACAQPVRLNLESETFMMNIATGIGSFIVLLFCDHKVPSNNRML